MKKTFSLSHPKLTQARHVDAIKYEVKKYLKRERKKKLPSDAEYWYFDCQFGSEAAKADPVELNSINKAIDSAVAKELASFYLEIIARPASRGSHD